MSATHAAAAQSARAFVPRSYARAGSTIMGSFE
jgi:hypothetical protein